MIEEKKTYPSSERFFFEDSETKKKFRRIVAGLAWPGVRPGFIAVIGEELEKDLTLQVRSLRLLGEAEEADISVLLRKAVDFRGYFRVKEFLGNSEDKSLMEILRLFNGNLVAKNIPGLFLHVAPNVNEERSFYFYASMVRDHLKQDRKTLHLGEGSKVARYLQELPPEEILRATALDFPAIAAVGYAVAYLDSWQPRDHADNWRDRVPKGGTGRFSTQGNIRGGYGR